MASWPSGKARVCKTLITGSNPVDASWQFRSRVRHTTGQIPDFQGMKAGRQNRRLSSGDPDEASFANLQHAGVWERHITPL